IGKERRAAIWMRIRDKTQSRKELESSFYPALRTKTQAVTSITKLVWKLLHQQSLKPGSRLAPLDSANQSFRRRFQTWCGSWPSFAPSPRLNNISPPTSGSPPRLPKRQCQNPERRDESEPP